MSSRDLQPSRCNMAELVHVHARAVFADDVGAADAGAEAAFYNHNGFIRAISRSGEGTFKVFFADKWLGFGGMLATRVKDADCQVIVLDEDVDHATAGSGFVQIAFQTAGSDDDPDGETVELNFWLHNSTAGWNAA